MHYKRIYKISMKLAIIDFNRTLFDPEKRALISGAREGLMYLAEQGLTLVLVSRREGGRAALWKTLGIAGYFAETHFVEEKTKDLFEDILLRFDVSAEETYVIGDYLPDEISIGNSLGAKTIHVYANMHTILDNGGYTDVPWKVLCDWWEIRTII